RVGIGSIDNVMLKNYASSRSNALMSFLKNKISRKPTLHKEELEKEDEGAVNYDSLVFGKEDEKLDYKLSTCCNPIPGDKVFAFVTVSEGIKVHKKNCPNALSLQSNYAYRIMPAKWIDSNKQEFSALIFISGIDNIGLVNEVTKIISGNMHVNMKSLSFESNDGLFSGKINLIVNNNTIIKKVVEMLKKINGIDKVYRV